MESWAVRNLRFDAGWVRLALLALMHSVNLAHSGHDEFEWDAVI